MSTEHVLPEWLLEAAAEREKPPEDLGSVASTFLGTLYNDPLWSMAQQERTQVLPEWLVDATAQHQQLSRDNSIEGILWRLEALPGIGLLLHLADDGRAHRGPDPQEKEEIAAIQRSLAAELKAAEEEFRARAPQIAEQLPEAAKAAKKTPADSLLALAAKRIARTVRRVDLSTLGPYWMLVVLYWLIVHVNVDSLVALTLWYMVASDTFKKKD